MRIKLAVFDMAGTTVADNDNVNVFFQKAFRKNSLEVKREDIQPFRGLKKMEAVSHVLGRIGVEANDTLIEKIHEDFIHELSGYYRASPEVNPANGAEEIFLWLKQKNIRVALNTGFPRFIAALIINRFQWQVNHLIDEYISGDDAEKGRPHPFMIRKLMNNAGLENAGEVIKIGDTTADIEEGRNAGCGLVVGITTGALSRTELEKANPDHIIARLTELKTLIH